MNKALDLSPLLTLYLCCFKRSSNNLPVWPMYLWLQKLHGMLYTPIFLSGEGLFLTMIFLIVFSYLKTTLIFRDLSNPTKGFSSNLKGRDRVLEVTTLSL